MGNLAENIGIEFIAHGKNLGCINPYYIGLRFAIYLFHIRIVYSLIIMVFPPWMYIPPLAGAPSI